MAQTAAPDTSMPELRLSAEDAQAICAQHGYVPTYELLPGAIEDWGGALHGYPLFYYPVRCDLHSEGLHVGQGNGSCNNWERKYRYRGGERTCPKCGASGTIIRGKLEYERDPEYKRRGAWLCFERRGGCGAKYFGDDATITQQDTGRVENADFADIVHVVRRMADKRALVAAVLNTPGFHQAKAKQPAAAPAVKAQAAPTAAAAVDPDKALTGAEWKAQQPTLGQLRAQAAPLAAEVGERPGTQAAADAVAKKKIAQSAFPKFESPAVRVSHRLPANLAKVTEAFDALRAQLSASEIAAAIAAVGGPNCHRVADLASLADMQAAYDLLLTAIENGKKGAAA